MDMFFFLEICDLFDGILFCLVNGIISMSTWCLGGQMSLNRRNVTQLVEGNQQHQGHEDVHIC